MDPSFVVIIVVVALALIFVPRMLPPRGPTCTRCDGSGQISERWPDPSQEGGWHVAEGSCPRCNGKGRMRS
ncbi:MAG: hypothetical protein QF719_07020 [Chloroflexota bacterium]|jgi:hypothetical protein|nr:hypothetical protein [Chloroflexota bacterium]MDP6757948.1 hypothetical protein [Chloroflexota bacterium]